MADHGLFIGFGIPVRGREKRAMDVFAKATQYYAELERKGTIVSWEAVLLDPHGGDLGGFILLRGERDKLAMLRTEPEFLRLLTRASIAVEDMGVIGAALGSELQRQMAEYMQEIEAVPARV